MGSFKNFLWTIGLNATAALDGEAMPPYINPIQWLVFIYGFVMLSLRRQLFLKNAKEFHFMSFMSCFSLFSCSSRWERYGNAHLLCVVIAG